MKQRVIFFKTLVIIYILATSIIYAPITAYSYTFRDDFDGSISSSWQITNQNSSLHSLSSGELIISSTNTDTWGGSNNLTNLFTIRLSSYLGSMSVTAKLRFPTTPYQNWQQGGIIILADTPYGPDMNNFYRVQYGYLYGLLRTETARETNANPANKLGPFFSINNNSIWLRLVGNGNSYEASYSLNGSDFVIFDNVSFSWSPGYIGIHAMNGWPNSASSIPVYFDFFEAVLPDGTTLTALPTPPQEPTPSPTPTPAPTPAPATSSKKGTCEPCTDNSECASGVCGIPLSGSGESNRCVPTSWTVYQCPEDNGGGCFLATAAYGSAFHPYVNILREFRDRFLLSTRAGKGFVNLYNTYSPPIASLITKYDSLRLIIRVSLIPLIGISWLALKIGVLSTMAVIIFFCIVAIGICRYVRYNKVIYRKRTIAP